MGFIEGRTRRWLDRNARVVTLPNDSGVGLMVGGKLWQYTDGKPIMWTWDQVHQASEEKRARVNEQIYKLPEVIQGSSEHDCRDDVQAQWSKA